jgi:ribonuclease BN (tRNA processing enzyme)
LIAASVEARIDDAVLVFVPARGSGVQQRQLDQATEVRAAETGYNTAQESASVLMEVGNPERDFCFFDLGSGSLANFNDPHLPVTAATKVFRTHLHADHVGDMPTLVWSLAKAGRRDPVEVTEDPFESTSTVYERNGVRISSFPVIHILNGAVGYRLDYKGLSVVFSGDTRPSHTLVDACDGADLLIHESFPSASVFAQKAGLSLAFAEQVVNGAHTSPSAAGKVFTRARPNVGDAAPGRRPRHRDTCLCQDAHRLRRTGHDHTGPHHVQHRQGRRRRTPHRH